MPETRPKLRLIDRVFGLIGVPSATNHHAAMVATDAMIAQTHKLEAEAVQLKEALIMLERVSTQPRH